MGGNKMKGKGLLVFAAVLVLLTVFMCSAAFAEVSDTDVAKIGDTGYATLDEAIAAVETDAVTINVLKDTTVSGKSIKGKTITFDGSNPGGENFTITVIDGGDEAAPSYLFFRSGSTVVFQNINITRTVTSPQAVVKTDGGNVTLESGAVIKDVVLSDRGAAVQTEGGSVTMKAGSRIENCKGNNSTVRCHSGSFIMDGGEITGCQAPSDTVASVIYMSSASANVTINGGTISGNGSTKAGVGAIQVTAGTLTVAKEAVIKGNIGANIVVAGGTLVAPDGITDNFNIDGGNYYYDIDTHKALIGNKGYSSVSAAVTAAKTGETVRLTQDQTSTQFSVGSKEITLDGSNIAGGEGNYVITMSKGDDTTGTSGSLRVIGNGILNLTNITITSENATREDGTSAVNYGAVYVSANGILNLKSGSVIKKTYGRNGGAIFIEGASANANMYEGSLIDGCHGLWHAPITAYNGGTFTMYGGTVTGCNDGVASAIMAEQRGNVNILGGSITGNGLAPTGKGAATVGAVVAYGEGTVKIAASADVTQNGVANVRIIDDEMTNADVTYGAGVLADGSVITGNITLDNAAYFDTATHKALIGCIGYTSLDSALSAVKTNETIRVITDTTLSTITLDANKNITVDGSNIEGGAENYTVTLNKGESTDAHAGSIKLINGSLSFRNINITREDVRRQDGSSDNSYAAVWVAGTAATLYLKDGAVMKDLYGRNGAAIFIQPGLAVMEEGSKIINCHDLNRGAVGALSGGIFTVNGGEIIDCEATTANNYSAVHIDSGTLNLNGGSITNNGLNTAGKGAIYIKSGTVNVNGDVMVTRNGVSNIVLTDDGVLNIGDSFTGNIGVNYKNTSGAEIGTVADGVTTLPTIESVVCDTDATLYGYVSDGKLILTKKLNLTPAPDSGKYTKAGGETVYGVVRVNTIVTEVADASLVEEMGTYFYVVGASDPGIVEEETKSNCFKPELTALESGMGYTADLVDIDEETATVYAVNFYKVKGIDGYVFEAPVPVAYAQETAKDLGNDPSQLNY